MVGSVERVDLGARRLYLRPNGGERRVVVYSQDAQVFYRGRVYPVTRLAPGDVVAMQMKHDTHGEPYVDLIRIQEENVSDRVKREDFTAEPRVAGTIQNINRRDDSFELNNRPGQIVSVALSSIR